MKKLFALTLLSGALCALTPLAVQAETIVVNFEEYASQIGNNNAWQYLSQFPADFGTTSQVESAYGGYATELAYQSGGVTFYNQEYLGTRLSTKTETPYSAGYYLNNGDMASVTGTGNNGSQTYGVVFGSSSTGLPYNSLELPRISLPTEAILQSIALCNTSVLAYLLENGDPNGFSSPMANEGDFFNLIIYGIGATGELIDSLTVSLGSYSNGSVSFLNQWTTFDLSSLSGAAELTFAFDGNDIGYGTWLNLPVYFAFDDLTYIVNSGETDTSAATPEPATLLIFGLGFVGLAAVKRKRKSVTAAPQRV
ncbi:MAG: DUF4465 domain-containing protein [Planctomycetaceae bacterium]|jgi:hypothetical protein|nr:DUF4465 domain-containing protein [Planctomycetaceae bacterium]